VTVNNEIIFLFFQSNFKIYIFNFNDSNIFTFSELLTQKMGKGEGNGEGWGKEKAKAQAKENLKGVFFQVVTLM